MGKLNHFHNLRMKISVEAGKMPMSAHAAATTAWPWPAVRRTRIELVWILRATVYFDSPPF
jgi:hypothetical protein